MGLWRKIVTTSPGGRFRLVISIPGQNARQSTTADVTTVRGATTQLTSYTSSDPFGDSTASFTFPSITIFDDLDAADLRHWLHDFANVDVYWLPAISASTPTAGTYTPIINPLTNKPDILTPNVYYTGPGPTHTVVPNQVKVWEGYLASMEFSQDDNGSSLVIQCQGALFQHDRYTQKPFYPARPFTLESLIADALNPAKKPHLRTQPLKVQWPVGWSKVAPNYSSHSNALFTPNIKPGTKWSGYQTRSTGAWDRVLTGFVQDNLAVMLTQDDSGVRPGNQWTVGLERQSTANPMGRTPVLYVRDRYKTADFSVWCGTPGISINMTRDTTQVGNIIYGDGTDFDGQVWRNAVIASDGSRTDYLPLAADRTVYPYTGNPSFNRAVFASEEYVKYGAGFGQDQATSSAQQTLRRDQDPGWSGTVTLKTDPTALLPRWLIRAGMTVQLLGFAGTGETGMPFHISQVEASPQSGTVTLTVDTRFRDLLTLEQSLARTRDPLTPTKMLQVNKNSLLIPDVLAPWDYTAGSGFIPKASTGFFRYKPSDEPYPWVSWREKHAPSHYGSWYVRCNANAPDRYHRWSGPIPILSAERGTIQRSEFIACDFYGRPLQVPFHVSIYDRKVPTTAMPRDIHGPSPYINGAFADLDPRTGLPWTASGGSNPLQAPAGLLVGWGNYQQRAGFSPGRESDGTKPTGLLFDDSTWTFDNTGNGKFILHPKPGQRQTASAITLYAQFYCEYSQPVYFMGRLYIQNLGSS